MKTAEVANSKANKRGKVREMEKAAKVPAPAIDHGEVITADNVQSIAERVAIRALRTVYAASGHPYIGRLYVDTCKDVAENFADHKQALSDGADVVQVAAVVLTEHIGMRLHDAARTGEVDKAGKPVDVLRATFRAVSRYIDGQRHKVYKQVYLQDGAAACGYIPAHPFGFTSADEYKRTLAIIAAMKLAPRQKQVLAARLRGLSIHAIAEKYRLHRSTVQECLRAIGKKYLATIAAEK